MTVAAAARKRCAEAQISRGPRLVGKPVADQLKANRTRRREHPRRNVADTRPVRICKIEQLYFIAESWLTNVWTPMLRLPVMLPPRHPSPNLKAMHERSAETWESHGRGVSETAGRTVINLVAKSASIH